MREAPHAPTRHRGHARDAASAADLIAQGNAAFEKGDLDRSLALALKAAKSGGGEDAYLLAGDSALKKGKRAQAEHAYKVALKMNPSSRAAQRGLQLLHEMSTGEPPQTDPTNP
jgi:tetratricopeptide (TPR) repeat protein